jgi:hypothetical protein
LIRSRLDAIAAEAQKLDDNASTAAQHRAEAEGGLAGIAKHNGRVNERGITGRSSALSRHEPKIAHRRPGRVIIAHIDVDGAI